MTQTEEQMMALTRAHDLLIKLCEQCRGVADRICAEQYTESDVATLYQIHDTVEEYKRMADVLGLTVIETE